ncbi:hydrolase [Rhodovibrionaceae bacterium A322]
MTDITRLISSQESQLLLIDLQGRLAPAIEGADQILARTAVLVEAAQVLDLPMLCSEQYPQGLGGTVASLAALLPEQAIASKTHFSLYREAGWPERLLRNKRKQIVVAGMETHVCVLQSVLDLLKAGYDVFVVRDACGSRQSENKEAGLLRMAAAGAQVVTSEMVVFEWLEDAKHPQFKTLIEKIK